MICVKCGADIPDSAKFCPKCGFKNTPSSKQDVALKKCPQCGTENPATAKFCRNDGTPLNPIELPSEEDNPPKREGSSANSEEVNTPKVTITERHPVKVDSRKEAAFSERDESVVCPICGTINASTAKFCKKDGTPLKGQIIQRSGNSELSDTSDVPAKAQAIPRHEEDQRTPESCITTTTVEEPILKDKERLPGNDFVVCPSCGTHNAPTAKFCKKDGTPLKPTEVPIEEGRPTKEEVKPDSSHGKNEITPSTAEAECVPCEEKSQQVDASFISSEPLVCPICGTHNEPKAKFCKKDGEALKGPNTGTIKVEEKADGPESSPEEQTMITSRGNQNAPETSSAHINVKNPPDFKEPFPGKDLAAGTEAASVIEDSGGTTFSKESIDNPSEERESHNQYQSATVPPPSPRGNGSEPDHPEHKGEGRNRYKKGLLITLSITGFCFILAAVGYHYQDRFFHNRKTPAKMSVPVPSAQLEKRTPPAPKPPEMNIPSQPMQEKAPDKNEKVKTLVNKPLPPKQKPDKTEAVNSAVSKRLSPEQKPLSLPASTQRTPVKIRTSPSGAGIYIDGQPKGTTPATVLISRGTHRVRVSHEGYKDAETKIDVQETMEFPIHLSLEPSE